MPHKFKTLMENSMLYPEGWRFREFVGNLKTSPSGTAAKRTRLNGNNVVDQVMVEAEQGRVQQEQRREEQLQTLQQEILQLRQQQGQQGKTGSGLPAQ